MNENKIYIPLSDEKYNSENYIRSQFYKMIDEYEKATAFLKTNQSTRRKRKVCLWLANIFAEITQTGIYWSAN